MRRFVPLALCLVVLFSALHLFAGEEATPEDLLKLGDTYYTEKTYKQAIESYERLLEVAPDHPDAFRVKMNICRSMIALRQWRQAVELLKPIVEAAPAGSIERAESLKLLGETMAQRSGGSREVVGWLEEAQGIFREKGRSEDRIEVLFAIGRALSYSWDYKIPYEEWEARYGKLPPDQVEVSWSDYQRQRQKEEDDRRYRETLAAYARIIEIDGDAGKHSALARYLLGCFHVNVLAGAFGTSPRYYDSLPSAEDLGAERQKLLERYLAEIELGISVWRELLEKNQGNQLADDARYLIAVTREQRQNDFVAAEREYAALLEDYPASEWADTARAALQQIRAEEIGLQVEKPFLPGTRPEIGFTVRNLEDVSLRAYRLDMPGLLKRDYRFHEIGSLDVTGMTPYAEWTIATGIADDRKGIRKRIELPFDSAGAFLVVASGERTTCRALVVISGIGMAMKAAEGSLMIFSADAATGEPAAGVGYVAKAVWREGRTWRSEMFTGVSGENGLATIDVGKLSTRRVNFHVAGSRGDHVALSQSWSYRSNDTQPYKVYTYTDRPVYRPNQTVHFRAIVRAATRDGYGVPDGRPVKVEILDPQGQKLFDKTLVASGSGTISGDLALPEEPALGVYQIRTFVDGRQYYSHRWIGAQFRVEEYKKPEFEVTVTSGASRVRPGSPVTVKVEGRYYFGAPVGNGELVWSVYRQPYVHAMPVKRRFDWYYRDLYPRPSSHWGRELVAEGKDLLDADGVFEIGFQAKDYGDGMDSRFVIEAAVTDASRREIRASSTVFATRQPFFTRVEALRSLAKPGDRVEVELRAEDANRKPVSSVGLLLLMRRVDTEVEKEDGGTEEVTTWEPAGEALAATRDDGVGRASIVVDEEGQFKLAYVTKDEEGLEIRAETHIWVVSEDFRGSQYRFSGVEVETAKDTWAVGEEMKVLVNSHVEDAWILLTVEAGNRILESRVVKAAGRSHVETMTVGEGWTPNVFVKALTIRDEAVFMNRREIVVPPVEKFMDVKVLAAKEGTYRPGEDASFTVVTTGADEQPVSTEVSVGFIDKAILYIAPDATPDIRESFYGTKRGDGVPLSSSFDFRFAANQKPRPGHEPVKYRTQGRPQYMNPWFYSYQGYRADFQGQWGPMAKGGGRGGARRRDLDGGVGGGAPPPAASAAPREMGRKSEESESGDFAEELEREEGVGEAEVGPAGAEAAAPRKFFPDTAFWNAHVTTGADGTAEVTFGFPDSLTTWKATVRGATAETAVGSAEAEFVTTKNLLVRLQSPRFFRERDEVVVSGIVHNKFPEDVAVRLGVQVEGGTLELLDRGELSKPELAFTVAAGHDQRVDWWFKVLRPGKAAIRVDAISERESDAVRMEFPVYEHGVEKYTALGGSFTGRGGAAGEGGTAEMRFVVPEDRHADASDLTVTVSPSIAGVLLETLPYLADYPYGCVEQTMSRFLPTVIVRKTLLDLGYTLEDLGVDPEREVPAGYWGRKEAEKLKVLRDEDLARAVAQGVQRLRDFQHPDGAWGWWKQGNVDLRITAYVVRGLALARAAGAEVDMQVLQRGAQFLFQTLARIDQEEREQTGSAMDVNLLVSTATAILEVAQLRDETRALVERIVGHVFERRENLGATGRALLAIALTKLGRSADAGIVCENLTDLATLDRENGTCRFGRVSGYYFWHDDAVEGTSEALRAYLMVKPKSDLIPMMVKWLATNRRGAHWKSTRDTAHAVLALCDYLRVSKELTPDLTVTISVGDRVAKTIRFTKDNLFTADDRLTLRGADLPAGTHVVTVKAEGTGNLYYSGALTVFTREEDVTAAGNEIAIERKAWRVHRRTREVTRRVWVEDRYVDRPVTEAYEEKEEIPGGTVLGVGDEIEIELVLTAKNDYRYLVFEDMKGAGFEPVELLSGPSWGGILSFREFRDERVAFFVSSLPQGEHRLRYRLRAEIPGDFHLMPAVGHAMYLPEVRAISDELKLSITEPGVR